MNVSPPICGKPGMPTSRSKTSISKKSSWRCTMAERIKQVAITYITHRLFFVGAVVGVLVFAAPNLIALSQAHSPSNMAIQLLAALGMPLLFLLPFLVRHVKTQFGHSRSQLLPGFATPHL